MPKIKKKIGHKPDTHSGDADLLPEAVEEETTEDTKKYSKRRIANNWAKYEKDINEEISEQFEDRDFKFLEKTTSSTNFFQLDEEKEWEKNIQNPDQSLFSLNVKQLTAGIACLPFYEVLDIDKKFITPENIDRCDKIAKNNVLRYRQDYPRTDEGNTIKVFTAEENVTPDPVPENEAIQTEPEDDELEEWLDRVLDN